MLKHLKRKSAITIPELLNEGVKRLVYFIMRDDYSGLLYAELKITKDLSEIREFLFNAWKQKDKKMAPLFGMPQYLMISQVIANTFPELHIGLDKLGIKIIYPSDGFSSGVRAIRSLEDVLRGFFYKRCASLDSISKTIETTVWGANGIPISRNKLSRFEVWQNSIDNLNCLDYDSASFMKLFFK